MADELHSGAARHARAFEVSGRAAAVVSTRGFRASRGGGHSRLRPGAASGAGCSGEGGASGPHLAEAVGLGEAAKGPELREPDAVDRADCEPVVHEAREARLVEAYARGERTLTLRVRTSAALKRIRDKDTLRKLLARTRRALVCACGPWERVFSAD